MTEQTNADLIDKLRIFAGEMQNPRASLMRDAAERLEAADQRAELAEANLSVEENKNAGYRAKNNQLAAVVEKVREYADQVDPANLDEQPMWPSTLRELLATAPADALREHDAALIEGLADEALGDELASIWVSTWLREKARQRREEQS